MKNLLLLGLVAFVFYLYLHPQQPEPVQAPPPVVQAAPPPPKMYYHSPLDAGAMPTNYSTGTGYYSSDPGTSRFNNVQPASRSTAAYGGYPVYAGGTTVNNTTVYAGTGARSTATAQSQPSRSGISDQRLSYPTSSTRQTSSMGGQ